MATCVSKIILYFVSKLSNVITENVERNGKVIQEEIENVLRSDSKI